MKKKLIAIATILVLCPGLHARVSNVLEENRLALDTVLESNTVVKDTSRKLELAPVNDSNEKHVDMPVLIEVDADSVIEPTENPIADSTASDGVDTTSAPIEDSAINLVAEDVDIMSVIPEVDIIPVENEVDAKFATVEVSTTSAVVDSVKKNVDSTSAPIKIDSTDHIADSDKEKMYDISTPIKSNIESAIVDPILKNVDATSALTKVDTAPVAELIKNPVFINKIKQEDNIMPLFTQIDDNTVVKTSGVTRRAKIWSIAEHVLRFGYSTVLFASSTLGTYALAKELSLLQCIIAAELGEQGKIFISSAFTSFFRTNEVIGGLSDGIQLFFSNIKKLSPLSISRKLMTFAPKALRKQVMTAGIVSGAFLRVASSISKLSPLMDKLFYDGLSDSIKRLFTPDYTVDKEDQKQQLEINDSWGKKTLNYLKWYNGMIFTSNLLMRFLPLIINLYTFF